MDAEGGEVVGGMDSSGCESRGSFCVRLTFLGLPLSLGELNLMLILGFRQTAFDLNLSPKKVSIYHNKTYMDRYATT